MLNAFLPRHTVTAPLKAALLLTALALPAQARDLGDRAEGNWAGASGGGFTFLAEFSPDKDLAGLKIWNGTDSIPDGKGEPELNVPDFGLAAFAKALRLEVVDGPDGAVLQVITDFADEAAEGSVVVEVQYLDFQFTVTGYSSEMVLYGFDTPDEPYSCKLDLLAGTAVENGKPHALPAMDSEALNASQWSESAPYDRGWCKGVGEG